MFWLLVLLLFVGIVLFMLEIFLPYGISFIAGLLVIGFGGWLAFRHFEPGLGMLYLLVAALVSAGAAWWLFSSGEHFLTLKPPLGTMPPVSHAEEEKRPAIGDVVKVVQPLRPTGTVLWEGRRYAARSAYQETESPVGARVRVTGYDSTFAVVEPLAEEKA